MVNPRDVVGRRVAPGAAPAGAFTYSVVLLPAAGWAGIERRGDMRRRTRLRDGVVGTSKHRVIVDCRIRDRSRSGARLMLDKDRPLPKSFVLTDGASHRLYRADLIWQAGRDAGVKLTMIE